MRYKFNITLVFLALLFAQIAGASMITTTTIAGDQTQAGVSFINNGTNYMFYSFGTNGDGTGYIASSNGAQMNLGCGPGNYSCGISAFDPTSGYFVGGLLDANLDSYGFIGSGNAILATFPNLFFSSISGNSFAGSNGSPIYGDIPTLLASGSFSTIASPLGGAATTIKGNVICGSEAVTAVTGQAFCTVNGVRVALNTGSDSIANGYDPFSGNAFGRRNGCAALFNVSNGGYSTFARADGGSGCQPGEVTSMIPGLATILDGATEYIVANGVTMTAAAYNAALSLALIRNVLFAGDTFMAARIGNNSQDFNVGPTNVLSLTAPDDPPIDGQVPEPSTLTLIAVGAGLIAAARKRFGTA